MLKFTLIAIGIFVIFILLDLLWFRIAGNFLKGEIGSIARLTADGTWNVRIPVALAAYMLMSLGIMFFVLPRVESVGEGLMYGALFGFLTYGIYDLTNLATLSAWTLRFAIVDMVWGTLLNAGVTSAAFFLWKFWH